MTKSRAGKASANPDRERSGLPPSPPAATHARLRILVVDDDRAVVDSTALLLDVLGYDVRIAHDGGEAIAVAEDFRPEVVLLDIGMPRMNGYEAAQKIREQPWGRTIVLIALTGWGQERDRLRSKEAGFDGHLVKPLEISALRETLGEQLQARRMGQRQA